MSARRGGESSDKAAVSDKSSREEGAQPNRMKRKTAHISADARENSSPTNDAVARTRHI